MPANNAVETISTMFKACIARGEYAAGSEFYSVRKLSETYNVSHVTADRIIRQLVSDRYLDARPYRPPLVRGVPTEMPRLFGVVYYDDPNVRQHPHFQRLIQGLSRRQSERGHQLQLVPVTENEHQQLWDFLDCAGSDRELGLFIVALPLPIEKITELRDRQIPIVSLNESESIKRMGWPTIYYDSITAVEQAVDYLVERGRTKIKGVIGAPRRPGVITAVTSAFLDRLQKHGLQATLDVTESLGGWSAFYGKQATEKLLQRWGKDEIDGLLVIDDINALGAAQALREAGVELPGEMSLIAIGSLMADAFGANFTTIDVQTSKFAATAVKMLEQVCNGDSHAGRWVPIPPRLIVREKLQAEHAAVLSDPFVSDDLLI